MTTAWGGLTITLKPSGGIGMQQSRAIVDLEKGYGRQDIHWTKPILPNRPQALWKQEAAKGGKCRRNLSGRDPAVYSPICRYYRSYVGCDRNLHLTKHKAQDVIIKKLTRGDPTMGANSTDFM
jgi:hypothetical protein